MTLGVSLAKFLGVLPEGGGGRFLRFGSRFTCFVAMSDRLIVGGELSLSVNVFSSNPSFYMCH